MTNKQVKRYSQMLLKKIQKALPQDKDLYNEIAHLVVELRNASPKTPPPIAVSRTPEFAELRRRNEQLEKLNEQLKLDVEQQISEWQEEHEVTFALKLEQTLTKLKADYIREGQRRFQVMDAVTELHQSIKLYAFQSLELDRLEIAQTLIKFIDSLENPQPQYEFNMPDGNVVVWAANGEYMLGLVLPASQYRQFSETTKINRKRYKWLNSLC
jgi:hypothetical protein